MTDNRHVMIAVAPNGARKTPIDHPQLPVTPAQLAATAVRCREAGAAMIHLHVRDANLGHSLAPALYREAIAAIRAQLGDRIIIQITTEAVGLYSPAEQAMAVKEVRPEAVSLALRELCPSPAEDGFAAELFNWLHRARIYAQYILYDSADVARFLDLRDRGLIPGNKVAVLLVLGRYTRDMQSDPSELRAMAASMRPDMIWSACAFGRRELDCMAAAMAAGGHCRVGFENNLHLPDGSVAAGNSALVAGVAAVAAANGLTPATADRARELLADTLP